ncbi:MAG: response regulator transcription factor [Candidatus Marinarcus sp.]|uniref:response regulator transcription factor n=1 Tax=Candidatus Marinarcus sp. TaxID=3100987 RepID=UPI003B0046E2
MQNIHKILQNLTILYIEDEIVIRENITNVLKLFCKEVYTCENSEEALKYFNEKSINIIISDINLPNKNGLDFAKEIRTINKTIPIILLTARIDTKCLIEATKLKLVDYLIKPINFTELEDALKRCTLEIIENGSYEITFLNNAIYNVQEKTLYKNDIKENLTSKELALLEYLLNNKTRVVSQEELQENIWEDSFDTTDSAFKTLLNKLRHKIGKESIENISGVGYRIILK